VRDKDGISAAVDMLALAAELKAEGTTMQEHLIAFAEKFGGYASAQVSLRVDDLSEIGRMMTALRETPPAEVGGVRVQQIDDFANGFLRFPPNDILRIWVEGEGRIVVRPSGTEPKLKAYIDAVSTDGTGRQRLAAAERTVAMLERGMRDILR
jgi:phosphomannomutase